MSHTTIIAAETFLGFSGSSRERSCASPTSRNNFSTLAWTGLRWKAKIASAIRFVRAPFMPLPRPRYTILSLMTGVLVVCLVLALFVAHRDHQRRLVAHWFALVSAEANYQNAQRSRQGAERAAAEFIQRILTQDLQQADSEIALALSELQQSRVRLATVKRQCENGDASQSELDESLKVANRALLRLERAKQSKADLPDRTKDRTLNELKGEVERAKAKEATLKALYEEALAREADSFSF